MNNIYDFPVELQPIYLAGNREIPHRKAVVRTDDMRTLGIVSSDYGLVKHASVIDSFREAGAGHEVQEKIALGNAGATLFYQMTFPKVQMEVKKGDIVRLQMIAKNSYNGNNSLQIILGALRLVCTNGMIVGTQFFSFNFRHIGAVGGMTDNFDLDEYRQAYTDYIRLFSEKAPVMADMARRELPRQVADRIELFNPNAHQLPKYLMDEARASFENEGDHSVWGYYNALTFAVTHKMKSQNPDLAIRFGREAWKMAEGLMN